MYHWTEMKCIIGQNAVANVTLAYNGRQFI